MPKAFQGSYRANPLFIFWGCFEYIIIVLKVNDNIVVSCELKCGYESNLKLGLDVYLTY
jgi:hypothetical protein